MVVTAFDMEPNFYCEIVPYKGMLVNYHRRSKRCACLLFRFLQLCYSTIKIRFLDRFPGIKTLGVTATEDEAKTLVEAAAVEPMLALV